MPRNAWRALRTLGVALAAWAGYLGVLGDRQDPKLIPVAAAAVVVLLAVAIREHTLRRKKRELARWWAAVEDPAAQPTALVEVQQAIAGSRSSPDYGSRAMVFVTLTFLVAGIAAAEEAAEKLLREGLEPSDDVYLRTSFAMLALMSEDDARRAQKMLAGRPSNSGDANAEIEADLVEGLIDVELGRPEAALKEASRATSLDAKSYRLPALVVELSAIDALGRRDEALDRLRGFSSAEVAAMADYAMTKRFRALVREARPELAITEESNAS